VALEHAGLEQRLGEVERGLPPSVGSSASGRSATITCSTNSGVSGSTYVRSATSGSVMIVAGLALTSTTS